MTLFHRTKFWLLGIGILSISLFSTPVLAVPPNGPSNFCPHQGIFTERIVRCVGSALDAATGSYLTAFSNWLQLPIVVLMTLALVLMGFKIVMGDNQLKGKMFGLIFKVGLILWLTNDFGGLRSTVWGVMNDLQNIATSTLMSSSSGCAGVAGADMAVWKRIDCLMGRMFGFGPQAILSAGMIGMTGAAMFSGTMGLQLFATGLSAMLMMMMMVFRAVYTFLLAYTSIAFLMIMSPLIIPLMAFERTAGMFYKWLNQFIAAMIEPMILFAFLSFFFGTMESIVGDLSQNMQGAANGYQSNQSLMSTNIMFDPEQWSKLLPKTEQGQAVAATINPMATGGSNIGDIMRVTKLDLGNDQNGTLHTMIVKTISIIVTAYLMMSMIQTVPSLARGLVGLGENAATGTGMGLGRVPGENKMNNALNTGANNATRAANNSGGGGGLEGLGSFFTGMKNVGRLKP